MSAEQSLQQRIRPCGGRCTIVPSPVDEEQHASGIILPSQFDGDDGVDRGVIDAIDPPTKGNPFNAYQSDDELQPGTVVYYERGAGYRIGDVLVMDTRQIIAYEDPAE